MDTSFLFVSCPGGRPIRRRGDAANRHVQLSKYGENSSNSSCQARSAPVCMKLKFTRKTKARCRSKQQPKSGHRTNRAESKSVTTPATSQQLLTPSETATSPSQSLLDEIDNPLLWAPHNLPTFPGEDDDGRAVYFYAEVVATNLSGEIQSGFWQTYVLQRQHQEPAIRQAIVALSSAYWEKRRESSTNTLPPLSVSSAQQAQRALISLRKYLNNTAEPSYGVTLVCALLLYGLETLRGDLVAASSHLDSSLAIYSDWTRKAIHQSDTWEWDVIHPTLVRLDGSATVQDMKRVPKLTPPKHHADDTSIFHSAEQMLDRLTMQVCQPILAYMSRTLNGILVPGPELDAQLLAIDCRLVRWRASATAYINTHPGRSPQETLALLLCDSHYIACRCSVDELLGQVDSWNAAADEACRIAQDAVHVQAQLRQASEKKWSLAVGIAPPLLMFAQRATVEPERSRALEMVRTYTMCSEHEPICTSLQPEEWRSDRERYLNASIKSLQR